MSNQDASLFFDGTSASDFSIWKFFSDMEMFTNGSVLPDAAGYLHGFHTDEMTTGALGWPANNNIVRFSDATYDEISDRALSLSPTDPEYVDLVKQMQEIIVNQGAIIPLIHRGNVSAIATDIEGLGEPNGWDSEYWNVEDWFRSEG
jgi:peptide/nickel transport system substrate-binding protein